MSIELLAAELMRFLGSVEPEVMCITGKWGVGKTYAWNYFLRQAQDKKTIGMEKYAYVSLFGRNSLDDVRTAIVENTVDSRVAGKRPDLTTFDSIAAQLKSRGKSLAWLASFAPGATSYVSSANRALFLMLQRQIVCIDDLERAGSGLDVKNILGLVSTLKEEKSCKVVILLNREVLSGVSQGDFDAQLDKVTDTIITFEPTPVESSAIAIDKTTPFHNVLTEYVQALGIVNIRIIKKIETFSRRAWDVLAEHDVRVLNQAVHTIALAAYAKFQPGDAPPLEFIKTFNSFADLLGRQKDSTEDPNRHLKTMLRNYGFHHPDEFDTVIIEGVERGFFDAAALKRQADYLQNSLRRGDKDSVYQQAWRLFHDSFENNQDAVLDALSDAVKANLEAITPLNLSETVSFLKEFGRAEQAMEVLHLYINQRQEVPDFWDLDASLFSGHVNDPDVRGAFGEKFSTATSPPDPEQILKRIGEQSGWNPKDLVCLKDLTELNYVDIFKRLRGSELWNVVKGALMFRDVSNADDHMRAITLAVEGALRRIAAESPMNAKRVRRYGVQVEEPNAAADTPEVSF